MPSFDATAGSALDGSFAPAFFIFLDIVGDPIRATTFGSNVTFSGTGDADLDGQTFSAVDPTVLSFGDADADEGGSDTFSVFLSGIVTIDTALMAAIGTTSNWRGRTVRVWTLIYDATGTTAQGGVASWKTGYASQILIHPSPTEQTIELRVENYLAAFSEASERGYSSQKEFDPADTSAAATLAASNGGRGPGAAIVDAGIPSNPGGGGKGRFAQKLMDEL
jgi:hypothetical protein